MRSKGVWEYGNRTIVSFIELRMVGESYEATSWRSGPLSIVLTQSRARQHCGKG